MALIMPGIISGNLDGISATLGKPKSTAVCYNPYLADEWEVNATDLPDNSVLLLTLRGTLFVWESDWIVRMVREAEENPRICGIVFFIIAVR